MTKEEVVQFAIMLTDVYLTMLRFRGIPMDAPEEASLRQMVDTTIREYLERNRQ